MAWINRADNIGQRDWADLEALWPQIDVDFDTSEFLAHSLEDAIESAVDKDAITTNTDVVILLDTKKQFISELVYTQVKANHAFLCALQRVSNGNATWGVTDAYHASMMLMRSILAAFGIFICRVHERNVLVDGFPWMGRIDAQKKFKRTHKNWNNSARVISCTLKNIEQSDLFAIFQRVLKIATVPTEIWPEVIVQNIIRTDKTHFSSARNKLIYGSRFWFRTDDLLGECLSSDWSILPQRDFASHVFVKDDDATEIDCYCDCWVMYQLSKALHMKVYRSLTDSIDVFSYVDFRSELSGVVNVTKRFFPLP